MTSANTDRSQNGGTPSCFKCEEYKMRIRELERDANKKEDEILYAYRLREDDLFKIKELEDALFRAHNDTNKGGEKVGG